MPQTKELPLTTHEFYAPFAHIPGRYEWATIHSPTHGSFDCFIVLHDGTHRPVTVYVNSDAGERFMADRFPESLALRVAPEALAIEGCAGALASHRVVTGRLHAESRSGPVLSANMTFTAPGAAVPRAVPYGGSETGVWGSRYRCEGVDLELDASVDGFVEAAQEGQHTFDRAPGILTVGSYGALKLVE